MDLLLTIVSLIVLVLFGLSQYIKLKREEERTQLDLVYNKMEMFFVENNIHINTNYVEFLKVFKNLTTNPDYLDIEILLLSKKIVEKNGKLKESKKWLSLTRQSLPKEFNSLIVQFDKHSYEIIKLSIYKPGFVAYALQHFVISQLSKGVDIMNKAKKEFKFVIRNEEAITHSLMRNAFSA